MFSKFTFLYINFLADPNQMRSPSSWGYHTFPGLIPAPQPDASMNFSALTQLQQNPLQIAKPQTVNLQNTTSNMPVLPHVYPDARFQNMPQFQFRSTTNNTTTAMSQVTTTAAGINSFNQMGTMCPSTQMEPGHGMLQAACQQLNGPTMGNMNGLVNGQFMSTINSSMNNGVVNNGLTYRPQSYIPQPPMTTQKTSMPLTQSTYSGPVGPPNGMTFPMARSGMMSMMSQGMGVSTMAQGLNNFSGFPTPPRSDDQSLGLKQEPVDGVTDLSNHVISQGMADHVNNNGSSEGVLTERNGRSSPKVWRPY